MKEVFILLGVSAILAACTFGPNGICGPQTPAAYCDKAAYQRLINPKSYMEHWEKQGSSSEVRLVDWTECGGYGNGDFSPHIKNIEREKRIGETNNNAAYERLNTYLQQCMVKRGYRYTGRCYETTSPACVERSNIFKK